MLESAITFMPDPWSNMLQGHFPQGPLARVKASQSYSLRCGDGKLLALHLSSPQKFWDGVQNAFERTDLGADPRFVERELRIDHYLELKAEFQKTVVTKPREYWTKRLEEQDVPFAPIHTLPEVMEDPQVKHLETFFTTSHPEEGEMTLLRRPVRYDGSRDDQPTVAPPQLGEHTAQILDDLGYDQDAVARLRKDEIV
jgi:crotonobetainyl-CoA:carnitine CoA-transferase CaiB-like acyl-CoA transferase